MEEFHLYIDFFNPEEPFPSTRSIIYIPMRSRRSDDNHVYILGVIPNSEGHSANCVVICDVKGERGAGGFLTLTI